MDDRTFEVRRAGDRHPGGAGRSIVGFAVLGALMVAACTSGDTAEPDDSLPAESVAGAVVTTVADAPPQSSSPDASTDPPARVDGADDVVEVVAGSEVAGSEVAVSTIDALFVESFDDNQGLDRFRFGVYHRDGGNQEHGRERSVSGDNNAVVWGLWTGDHDLSCGTPDTQRPLQTDFEPDTTGENGWSPHIDFHLDELLYVCRDHLMTSMGDSAAYSVVWFSPDQVFDALDTVAFDVNLTDLGARQWWKVGVVTDTLFESTYPVGYWELPTPGHIVSDVGASDLDDLVGPDRLIASWSGGASAGHPGSLKIGDTKLGGGFDAGSDKKTRHPVTLTDNGDGTVTFSVAGSAVTTDGSFPECPCRVVFYDHNYTPDKDGTPIGHTWHWDNIVVR